MEVDIYITERASSRRQIRIPWMPDVINAETGEASMISYDILNVGEVVRPSGVGLSVFSWESIFPGENRTGLGLLRGEYKKPSYYDAILKDWKKKGTELDLVVTGYPINKSVYLTNYTSKASGGFGDLEYSLVFKEARTISVTYSTLKLQQLPPTRRVAEEKAVTYTVQSGDCLWTIAQKTMGDGAYWCRIYLKNEDIIEKVAKQHGRLSSVNGHWIYPGTVLQIPE